MQMQRKTLIWGLGLVLALVFWINGCGTSDLLDEVGQRYTATISIKDNDEETLSVDVVQDFCDEEAEDFFPASAAVSFTAAADAPGITLQNYILEYIPLESADGLNNIVMPPDLEGPLHGGNLGIDIASGGTASFEITCMSVDTKEEYRRDIGWFYKYETVAGQAELTALNNQIIQLENDIENTNVAIYNATVIGDDDEVARLTTLLELQQAQLEELMIDYQILYYSFDYDTTNPLIYLQEGRYRIRITFEFEDEYGVSRTVVREDTVWLGNFDNC